MDDRLSEELKSLINAYEFVVKGIDTKAQEIEDRAYGGIIRANKGILVENLAKSLIEIAWKDLGREPSRLSFEKEIVKIPIKREYLKRIKSPEERILVDFTLLKQVYPELTFVLFQLESQLGGDYSSSNYIKYGSPSTHTLLSYFDIDLNIITLLQGERKVDRPIHKPEYYKALKEENLLTALETLKNLLKT
jgi:hypothetical protein